MSRGKGRATPKMRTARERMVARGNALRDWLEDARTRAADRRRKLALLVPDEPGGSGVTNRMRNIRNTVPQKVIIAHKGPNREMRRTEARRDRGPMAPGTNRVYYLPLPEATSDDNDA